MIVSCIFINATADRGSRVEIMLTAAQLRAARALLGVDQRRLAELSDLSVPTIQRMEASEGVIRGNVESLMKLIGAINQAGIELIGEGASSQSGGRGVRLKPAAREAATTDAQTNAPEPPQMVAARARER
jgi:transcriptional regulator with XRE-family HTH domain